MVLSGESSRRLNVILSLQDRMSGQVKQAERNLTSFRSEVRRASVVLGGLSASLGLTLRSWVQSSNEARQSLSNIGATLSALGRDPSQILPDLAPTFKKIAEDVGKSIAAITDNFNELLLATGNVEFSTALLRIASGIEAITDKELDMRMFANAIAGEKGAVEAFRQLTGLDLSGFTTTADRIAAVSKWMEENLPRSVTALDKFGAAWQNFKSALGGIVIDAISGPLSALAGVFERLAANKELVTFGATFALVAAGVATLGAALTGLAWITFGNPLGLALAAIAIGIGLVAGALAVLKQRDPEAFERLATSFRDALKALEPLVPVITLVVIALANVLAALAPLAPAITFVVQAAIAPFIVLASVINMVKQNLEGIKEGFSTLGQGVRNAFEGVLNGLTGFVNQIIGLINQAIGLYNSIPILPNLPTVPPVATPPPQPPGTWPAPPVGPPVNNPQPPPAPPTPAPPPWTPQPPMPPPVPPGIEPPPPPAPTPPFQGIPPPWIGPAPPPGLPPGVEPMTANITINSMGDIDADRRIRLQVEQALRAGWGIR